MRKGLFTISAFGFCLVAFLAVVQAQSISTLAGGGPNNLPARSASIGVPWAVVQHGTTTYISDNLSNRVFKVDGTGNLTVFAGNIVGIYNQNNHGDGHLATTAPLNSPQGIALDSAGNVYIADTANNAIREVDIQTGIIQTVAGDGNGTAGYSGDGHAATSATLNNPGGVWLDADGNIYIADTLNSVIRVVNTQANTIHFPGTLAPTVEPGNIATIVGTGTAGFLDGPITSAKLNLPNGIFVTGSASKSNVVIVVADTVNNRIRAVNASASGSAAVAGISINAGNVAAVAGNGTACADPAHTTCGDGPTALNANLSNPTGVFADSSGNVFIADTNDNKIREVASTKAISTIAGNGTRCAFDIIPCGEGGLATSAELWFPTGVVLDANGNVMIADQNDDAIRTIVSLDLQTTVGAVFNTAYSGDKSQTITGTATNAEMREPSGLASDANGNVFIADTHNSTIRKVSNGIITSVVGNGFSCFTADCGDGGPASAAQLSFPFDVAFDTPGNMWIADSGNELIRVVNNQGVQIHINGASIQPGNILSVVGTGSVCGSPTSLCGDGGAATAAQLSLPSGIAFDAAGNLYIADTNDNRIRVVNNQGTALSLFGGAVVIQPGDIATVAGDGNPCADPTTPCGDGGAATAANLNTPGDVALDGAGNIYIADTGDNRVRVVDRSSGVISKFAGTGTACTTDCKNGFPAIDALLDAPQGLFVDLAGNVFIADSFDFEVREVTTDLIIHGVAGNETRGFSGDGGSATSAQLAVPYGVSGDPFGDLLIADQKEWRVRKVTSLVVTLQRADLSTSTLAFSNQPIHSTSPARSVTLSNDSFGNTLTISTNWTLSGTNASEFAIASNTCTGSLPAGSSCTVKITFSPTAKGNRVATLTITDNAGGVPNTHQTVSLSGTGLAATALGEQVDYFGDGKADLTVWRPSNGTFYSLDSSNKELIKQWGVSTDVPLIGDYDGDGKTDIGVWRPSNGTWYILQSNGKEVIRAWGSKGDIPVPGDYDGDGKTDFAIFRPSNGTWYILQSSNLHEVIRPWGAKGDIPVPGDYDGDGKTDFAIFRPSNGTWYILQSSNLQEVIRPWGAKGDIPVPGDYDGDGRTDFAIFRPSSGTWYILQIANLKEVIRVWGAKGDIPVARDYDGDGKADLAVWRPSNGTWYVSQSSTGQTLAKAWGVSTDIPMNKSVGQ